MPFVHFLPGNVGSAAETGLADSFGCRLRCLSSAFSLAGISPRLVVTLPLQLASSAAE
jgi:hypothetical protein